MLLDLRNIIFNMGHHFEPPGKCDSTVAFPNILKVDCYCYTKSSTEKPISDIHKTIKIINPPNDFTSCSDTKIEIDTLIATTKPRKVNKHHLMNNESVMFVH